MAPNEAGTAYTIPTVIVDDTWIMDSRKIAAAIEQRHPSPSVHLDSPLLPRVEAAVRPAIMPLMAIFYTRVPTHVLNPVSVEYWYRTRGERIGMSVFENERINGGEKAHSAAEEGWKTLTALLKENKGPYFMGETVSYADFVWTGALLFVKRADEELYAEMLSRSGDASVHEGLLNACEPWWRRDSH